MTSGWSDNNVIVTSRQIDCLLLVHPRILWGGGGGWSVGVVRCSSMEFISVWMTLCFMEMW